MKSRALLALTLCWVVSAWASQPGPHLMPRYAEPGLIAYPLPYRLEFDGACLRQRKPTRALLAFSVQADGQVASVRVLPPAPSHDALDELLRAAREFRFSPKYVEWQPQPFSTVLALPLPNRDCWHPPLGNGSRHDPADRLGAARPSTVLSGMP
ncbi:energy transducer TonB [Seongchinamella sediminis]|uniref:Energy transducer TonB n=1 Tax=Seongchinamella sediminis TaxID=2283635 RepID=A0A3L7DSF5_9GAMM|nr:energy transducer TonB [Seongchinamella sediminis]RLQ20438.1 energy transducer TonB [Seongchinamella sediminis]